MTGLRPGMTRGCGGTQSERAVPPQEHQFESTFRR
jgi:hypothetical protein